MHSDAGELGAIYLYLPGMDPCSNLQSEGVHTAHCGGGGTHSRSRGVEADQEPISCRVDFTAAMCFDRGTNQGIMPTKCRCPGLVTRRPQAYGRADDIGE
ncbi:MAG: hypothetical protein NVS3B21_22960 [Acidimicrobiales bacterium]